MAPRPHVGTFDAGGSQLLEDCRLLVDLDRKLQRRCSVGELRERSRDELAKLVEKNQVVRSPSCGNTEIGLAPDHEAGDPRWCAHWVSHLEGVLLGIEGHVARASEEIRYVPSLAEPTFEPRCEASQSPPRDRRHGRPEGTRGDDRTAVGKAKRLVQTEDRDVAERAGRPTIALAQPGLRRVLHEREMVIVRPLTPTCCVLRKTEVVDQKQDANAFAAKTLQIRNVGDEPVVTPIEARSESRFEKRLDL